MSEYLTRGFRAQLSTAMDSVLRRAVCEITRIFENSLHDHQIELTQKGEEVAHLKLKLQTAELKLRELECGVDGGVERNTTQMTETQREPEVLLNPSGQTSDVPEIDFEVPDDWCAPLGCEIVTKQEEDVCPSIRLRPLLIPLCRIPVIKQEVDNSDFGSHQQTEDVKESRRVPGPLLKDKSLPVNDQDAPREPMRNEMKKLLQDIKQEYIDSISKGGVTLRGKGRSLPRRVEENTVKNRRKKRRITKTKPEPTEQWTVESDSEKRYSCKFCTKVFDTEFGRSVHIRSHKRCKGCKKQFRFPSSLRWHKPSCKKLKKLLAKEALCTQTLKPKSSEEKPRSTSKKQVVIKEESSPSSDNHSKSSTQKDGSTGKYFCTYCNKEYTLFSRFKEHMRVHTGEKPFPCSMCPRKFHFKQALQYHKTRMHQDPVKPSERNGDLVWTVPTEDTEDNQGTGCTINWNNVQKEHGSDVRPSPRWQTMGVRKSNGFTCLLCQKFVRNKHLLIEHYRLHTGERPIKCENCPERFRTRHQLYFHRKRCCFPGIKCEKCDKKLISKAKYDKHVSKCLKEWPNVCKVCGKGFFLKGRLRNHMERCHS